MPHDQKAYFLIWDNENNRHKNNKAIEIEIRKTRSSDANILKKDLNLGVFLSLGFVKEVL